MSYQSRSALEDAPPVKAPSRNIPTSPIRIVPRWKYIPTISTVATAGMAAALLLASPELGIAAAAGGVAFGAVSAVIALSRPDPIDQNRKP